MSLDLSKLQNVKTVGGKTTARCPACAAAGGDAKGDHLVIYPDGGYGCVANPKDKAHTKEIFRLAGQSSREGGNSKITVRAVDVPPSSVVMDLQAFDRFRVAPTPRPQATAASAATAPEDTQSSSAPVDEPSQADEDVVEQEAESPLDGDWVDLDGHPVCRGHSRRGFTGEPLWSFLGVSEEEFKASTKMKPVAAEDVC